MLRTVPEIEVLSTPELKEILLEATKWLDLTVEQQYHSKLYVITSKLNEVYGDGTTVYQTVDLVAIETARRVANNLTKR